MKRIVCILLSLLMMFGTLTVTAYAASKAPKPKAYITQHDGYTSVRFDIPDGAAVRYTADGRKPSSSSTKYTGSELKVKKSTTLKLRVTKKGCTTATESERSPIRIHLDDRASNHKRQHLRGKRIPGF